MRPEVLDGVLDTLLTTAMPTVEAFLHSGLQGATSNLVEPSLRLLEAGGKRLRPIVVMMIGEAAEREMSNQKVLHSCAAVEYLHIGSLVHDDLIDTASQRRGVPTVYAAEGWMQSILVGDYILGRSMQMAAKLGSEATDVVAEAVVGISEGQAIEEATLFDPKRTEQEALRIIEGKTASLVRASCVLGAICGDLDQPYREALAAFGQNFGIAIQLVDDVLDWMSTTELVGKPVLCDMVAGVFTFPLLRAREAGLDISMLVDERSTTVRASEMIEAVRVSGGIDETVDLAKQYAQAAADELNGLIEDRGRFAQLAKLPLWYHQWALTNLIPPNRRADIAALV